MKENKWLFEDQRRESGDDHSDPNHYEQELEKKSKFNSSPGNECETPKIQRFPIVEIERQAESGEGANSNSNSHNKTQLISNLTNWFRRNKQQQEKVRNNNDKAFEGSNRDNFQDSEKKSQIKPNTITRREGDEMGKRRRSDGQEVEQRQQLVSRDHHLPKSKPKQQVVEDRTFTPLTSPQVIATKADTRQQPNLKLNHRRVDKRQRGGQVKREEPQVNLSFSGCGFLGIYHVGVASCFHEYAPQLSMHKISGSSAGALVAVAHICGNLQLAYATTDILRVAIDARSRTLGPFHPSFDISATVREALERGLPEDVHIKASGKLHVSLTRVYDGENVIISEFASKEDVIQVLLCSCFIPIWSGLTMPKYKGISYIDGGFSNNLLTLDSKTVTVSPFAGEADICPQDETLNLLQISISNTSFSISPDNLYRLSHALLPPPPEALSALCEQGFADGIKFLQRMKLISCTKCLEIRSSLLVTKNGEDMEEAVRQEAADSISLASSNHWTDSGAGGEQQVVVESQHIRLEHQEQKMIEIQDGSRRRDSVVSSTSQIFQQQQLLQQEVAQAAASANLSHLLEVGTSDEAAVKTLPGESQLPVPGLKRFIKRRDRSIRKNENNDELSDSDADLTDNELDENDNHINNDYDVDEDEHNMSKHCYECVQIRKAALRRRDLPKQFSDRIRDACDTVNKSLSNWIYSHRPIKYLSYLAAPYYLPIELSLALIAKCWQKLPALRSEISECLQAIVGFLLQMMKRMQDRSTSALLMAPSSVAGGFWSQDEVEAEAEAIKDQKEQQKLSTCGKLTRRSSVNSLSSANPNTKSNNNHQQQQHQQQQVNQVIASAFDHQADQFSLKITSDGLCVSKLVDHQTVGSENNSNCNINSSNQSGKSTNSNPQVAGSSQSLHSLEDTFDSIVDVTSNQEARIFAYYFRDAKNRLQVTEIFDLERAAERLSANRHSALSSQ